MGRMIYDSIKNTINNNMNKTNYSSGGFLSEPSFNMSSDGVVSVDVKMSMEEFRNNYESSPRQSTPHQFDKIQDICNMNRGGGSTNWILYSAVVNPNCVIVSRDETTSRYMANKFQTLVVENDTFKQFHEMNGGVEPSFYSLDQFFRMRGYGRKPVIFDNSSFF